MKLMALAGVAVMAAWGVIATLTTPVAAQSVQPVAASASEAAPRGQVTNLPIPRFVSLKAAEANIRRGPSLSHRIDWVFQRRGMPLRVTAEHGHWRRVEDREGFGGWVHYSLISGARTALVERDLLPLHNRPDPETPVAAALEAGVVASLGKCNPDWCRLSKDGYRGWARRDAIWGVLPGEVRE